MCKLKAMQKGMNLLLLADGLIPQFALQVVPTPKHATGQTMSCCSLTPQSTKCWTSVYCRSRLFDQWLVGGLQNWSGPLPLGTHVEAWQGMWRKVANMEVESVNTTQLYAILPSCKHSIV